ncbi:hypothetical protein [Mucilaginibacter sp. HD30]
MTKYFTIYTSAELICLIVALVCLFNAKERNWRLLIPFLLITCMVEIGAIPLKTLYRANPIPQNSNAWIYNILLLVQIATFLMMFYNIIGKYTRSLWAIIMGLAVLLIFYSYDLITNKSNIFDYNASTYAALSVVLVLYSLYYYFLLLNNDEYTDLKYSPEFWWVTGTLFFFFGATTVNIFHSKLLSVPLKNRLYLTYISNMLIVILYGCWTYAFICKRWITSNKK